MNSAAQSNLSVANYPLRTYPRWTPIAARRQAGVRSRSIGLHANNPAILLPTLGLLRTCADLSLTVTIVPAVCSPEQVDAPNSEETKARKSPQPEQVTERPVHPPLVAGAEQKPTASPLASPQEAQQAIGRVLLVDDESVNQLFLSEVIRSFGLECDIASDGLQAVQAFSQNSYDLVFMDYHMPLMDGLAAARQMRQLERSSQRRRTPIIGLTANLPPEVIGLQDDDGMDDYLTKPVDRQQLGAILTRWLSK